MTGARWLPRSLAVRVTLLCGLIAVSVTGMLGGNYFFAARSAILAHADEQLVMRVERLRRLLGGVRTVQELRDQTMLLEALSGNSGDVFVVRRADAAALVEVNPGQLAPPACAVPAALDRAVARGDVCHIDAHRACPACIGPQALPSRATMGRWSRCWRGMPWSARCR